MAEVTQRELEKIRTDIHNLRDRFSLMLSRTGGHINGQVDLEGWLQLDERAAPAQPAAGFGRLYAKSDDKIYWQDDGGTEHDLTSGGGGPGAPSNAQYLVLGLHADLSGERRFVASTGLSGVDGGADGDYTLSINEGEISHDGLADVSVDDHHAQAHVVNSTGPHAEAGLTTGHVLRASGAGAFSFAQLQHTDLGGVTADLHHNRSHAMLSVDDHTYDGGGALDVFGLSAASTLALLTPSANPGAAAAILKTDASGHVTLVELNTGSLDDAGTGSVDIHAHLIPYLTDTYDWGSSTKLWRKGWLSELDAVLFAENTITLLGGWFYVTKYAGTVQEDVDDAEVQIDFGVTDAVMAAGDFVVLRQSLAVEYMTLGAYAGANVWNVTRNVDGSGANAWPQGEPFACFGQDGDGRVEINAYDTPRISILRQGVNYNQQTELIRMGDLNGLADYAAEAYGIFIGDYAGDKWLAYDETNSLRIRGDALIEGTVTATKLAIGDSGVFSDNGLLLLGPGCELTATSWKSLRGQEATIANAFQTRAGAFPGTQGIVMEPGTTNYCFNGAMRDDDDDDSADSWTLGDNCTDPVSVDVQAHPNPIMGWLQRFYYTGVAGDVNVNAYYYYLTAAASFAEGEDACVSCDIRGAVGGSVTVAVRCRALNAANGSLGVQTQEVTVSAGLQRVYVVYESLPADTDKVRVDIRCSAIDVGDWFNVFFGAVNVEKRGHPTTFCSGQLPWCDWDADEYDSESDRTGTTMQAQTTGNISATKGSILIRFRLNDAYNAFGGGILWCAGNLDKEFEARIYTGNGGIRFYINGGLEVNVVAATALNQDHCAIFTWDVAEDESEMFLDGVSVGTGTCGGVAPSFGTGLSIGRSPYAGTDYNLCGVITEFAVFGDLLTADEIAANWNLRRPIIDHGATDTPGIYIMDGRFRISSAYTGTRIEITPDEIAGYSGVTKQFYLSAVDGKAYAGAGKVGLDAGGAWVLANTTPTDFETDQAYTVRNASGTVMGGLGGHYTGDPFPDRNSIILRTEGLAGKDSHQQFMVYPPSGQDGEIEWTVYADGSTLSQNTMSLGYGNGTPQLVLSGVGIVNRMLINDTANIENEGGLTINQEDKDDEILSFKSSDIGHGATSFTETDTFGHISKAEAGAGGLLLRGLRDGDAGAFAGLSLHGALGKNADTDKTTGAQGVVAVYGFQTSGADVANMVANGNVCSFHTYRGGAYVAVVIIDEDGDIYFEGSTEPYHDQDDIALLRELDEVFSQPRAEHAAHALARENDPKLEKATEKLGLVHINEDGSAFISTKQERALLRGAAIQVHDQLTGKIAILEARIAKLEEA